MDLLKSIAVFQEVCKYMSFSKAADQLNIVPSAVSRQINELEKYLDARLLQRTTRAISLTDAGKRYLQKMDVITENIHDLRGLDEDERYITDHIRLTAPPIFASLFLNNAFQSYLKQCPDVSLSTTLVNREIKLIEEGYDLALRVGELDDSNLVARNVGKFSLSIVVSPGYIDAHGEPVYPKDLIQHNCLINTLSHLPRRWRFQNNKGNFSIKIDGDFDANDDVMLRSLAGAGRGIAYLPSCFVAEQINKGELISVLNEFIPPPLPISVIYPSRIHLSQAKRILINHLIQHIEHSQFSLANE